MKIAFIEPPPLVGKRAPERVAGCAYGLYPVPNIFVLSVAAMLERAEHKVTVENFPLRHQHRFDFEEYLRKSSQDCYFIYGVNLSRATDLVALDLIRHHCGQVPVVFFGPSPSDDPEVYLRDESCFVIRGEPEETAVELVATLSLSTAIGFLMGVSSRDGAGEVTHGPFRPLISDLDSVPFPARHLTERDLYYNPKLGIKPFTQVLASRNCPYHCQYCVPCSLSFAVELEYRRHHNRAKPPARRRSVANIVAEVSQIAAEGYRSFAFADDQFVLGEQRAIEICDGISAFGLAWGCASRVDHLTEPVVEAMARAGCRYIDLGIESFSQEILDDIGKDLDIRKVEPVVEMIRRHGIAAKANILLGASPLETIETIQLSLKRAEELRFHQVMVNICNPFPGTDYYIRARENGWLIHGDYVPSDVQKEAIIRYPNLDPDDFIRLVRRANRRFFLNPRFIFYHLQKIHSPTAFYEAVVSLWRKLTP